MSMSWAEYEDKYGESRQELMRSKADEEPKPKDIAEYFEGVEPLRKELEQLLKKWDKDCEPEKTLDIAYELEDLASQLHDLASEEYFDYENWDGCHSEEERVFGAGGFHGWANPGLGKR